MCRVRILKSILYREPVEGLEYRGDVRPSVCLSQYSGSSLLYNLQPVYSRFIEIGEKYIPLINRRRDVTDWNLRK